MESFEYQKIELLNYPVYLGNKLWGDIDAFLQPFYSSGKVFILTDDNTRKHCLPVVLNHIKGLYEKPVFSIRPGEENKNAENLFELWKWLIFSGAEKDSLLINLGGGMVSDLGGFAAATTKRGISYINIPTSLIGQADAAIGGKTGINVKGVKNQVGAFYDPAAVFIIPGLLQTLPEAHILSGLAEIIKSAFLAGNGSWKKITQQNLTNQKSFADLIFDAVFFKCKVVINDPFDLSSRQILNFGHTVGHALESFFNAPGSTFCLHGEAVAMGMICEAYISCELLAMNRADLDKIAEAVRSVFNLEPVPREAFEPLWALMAFDKKKSGKKVLFSLTGGPGKPVTGIAVENNLVFRSFEFYNSIVKK